MSLNLEQANAINANFVSGLIAAGSAAAKVKTVTNTLVYTINGIIYTKAATDDFVVLTGTALAIGQSCLFACWIDKDGNSSCSQGPIVAQGDICPLPPMQPNKALFGIVKVHLCTAAFTPGTTSLGTGNTAVYYNCSTLPGTGL